MLSCCRFIAIGLVLILVSVAGTASASPAKDNSVSFRFYGSPSLEGLSQGEIGRGLLVYFLTEDGTDVPKLAVDLERESGWDYALAQVYDVPVGQTAVPLETVGGQTVVREDMLPTVTIRARDGWWVRNGIPNYSLDVSVVGRVFAAWGAESYLQLLQPFERSVSITTRAGNDGFPDWDLRQVEPALEGSGILRTNFAERKCFTPTKFDISLSPLWPYITDKGEFEQGHGAIRPPIVVDLKAGRVTFFSELVTVRNQNCSYSFYSINSLMPDKLNQPDFETPFAYYDLSQQGKGYSNLILRTERFPVGDPWAIGYARDFPTRQPDRNSEQIRYSWRDEVGDWLWDYKVDVMGFNPYQFETPIASGKVNIDAPPYESFPKWVVDHSWPAVTFVDTEGASYRSSEGIYEWSPDQVGRSYLMGWKDSRDLESFADIPSGFRGEYRFDSEQPPVLYMGGIDKRLHLQGAERGLYKLGSGVVMHEARLGGGDHINAWARERLPQRAAPLPTEPLSDVLDRSEETLYALDGHLLYSGPGGVELRQAPYQESLFQILPPTDNQSWQEFRTRVAGYKDQKQDPFNLRNWMHPFSGIATKISRARVSQVRPLPEGFRFVLELEPGFKGEGDALVLGSLEPGSYLVTYQDQWQLEPLTPPALSATIAASNLSIYQPAAINLVLENSGSQDVDSVTVELTVTAPTGRVVTLTSPNVALLGRESTSLNLRWVPFSTGDHQVTVRLKESEGQVSSLLTSTIHVDPEPVELPQVVAAITAGPRAQPAVLLGLSALGMLAASSVWLTSALLSKDR